MGKCGLKVLQYLAAGLPVIANPVGVHVDMVEQGINGYLALSDEDWIRAIGRLAADPELRLRMGKAGRARVEAHYDVDRWADDWSELVFGIPNEVAGVRADAGGCDRSAPHLARSLARTLTRGA
jgi:glycosyltransferase involved in cell wall biosynthesis